MTTRTTTTDLTALRREIRQQRRALSAGRRHAHAELLAHHFSGHDWFRRAQRIAAFLPSDGEQDPTPLIELAWERGKHVFLPVLNRLYGNRLWFFPYLPDSALTPNRFGILEPPIQPFTPVPAWTLDLVLTPLVAFDVQGNRLGMGGGYYDRTFAFLRHNPRNKPRLLGVAHALQKSQHPLPRQTWDVPLQGVITEDGLTRFATRSL
jgi:5-formyltetrahydrofolate cyclo-ligase